MEIKTLNKNRSHRFGFISLTKGKEAKVDYASWDYLKSFNWYAFKGQNTFYGAKKLKIDGKVVTILMHHLVVGYPLFGQEVDHIDGDGLNNKRDNLRIVTKRQNLQNQKFHRDNPGRPLGIYFHDNRWVARIMIKGERKSLGRFLTQKEAGQAYKEACNGQ